MDKIKLTLEAARVNAGLTQQAAADLFGIDRTTLVKWENGYTSIPYVTFCGMAYLYKVPVECLIMPEKTTK